MKRSTTAARQRIAVASIRGAWATIRTGERVQRLGERMEAGAQRLADRWRCGDQALDALTEEALSREGTHGRPAASQSLQL